MATGPSARFQLEGKVSNKQLVADATAIVTLRNQPNEQHHYGHYYEPGTNYHQLECLKMDQIIQAKN
jgi:hypothetical protein